MFFYATRIRMCYGCEHSKCHSQLLSHAPANPSKSGGSERLQDRRPKKSLTFR